MTGIQTRAPWRSPALVVLCGALILSLSMGVRQTFGLFALDISSHIGIGLASFGFAMAVQNLLWGILTPIIGMVADRYGTTRVVAVGGVLYAGGTLLMTYGGTTFALYGGGGFLVGLAVSASGFPLILSVVARVTASAQRSMALGIASAGGTFGQFVLSPTAGLLTQQLGWMMTLAILGALTLFMVPLAFALVVPKATAKQAERAQAIPQITLGAVVNAASTHKGFMLLTAGFFVCGFHIAFVGIHLPSYLVSLSFPPFVGATALGIIGFFNIVGTVTAGYLGGVYRKKYLLCAIYTLRALIIVVFLIGPKSEWSVWIFTAVFGLLWLSTVPLTSGIVGQIFGPRYMATLFGIVMLSHQLGAFFGAWFGGLVFDHYGSYDMVWYMAIGLGVASALLHGPIEDTPIKIRSIQAAF